MKKFISLLLSAAMIIAPASQVFAEEEVIEDGGTVIIEDEAVFDYSEVIDGYKVSLSADAGVFPVGSSVTVEKSEDDSASEALIEASLSEDERIKKSVKFDITFKNPAGEVVEPENGLVNVAIDPSQAFEDAVAGGYVAVYHITDDATLEKITTVDADVVCEDGVVFDAASFSSYTLTIIEHNGVDMKGPTLKNVKFLGESTNLVIKDYSVDVQFEVDAVDDMTGVKSVNINLKEADNKAASVYVWADNYSESKIAKSYISNAGKYIINYVQLTDNAGNYSTYYRSGEVPSSTNCYLMPKSVEDIAINVTNSNVLDVTVKSLSIDKTEKGFVATLTVDGADGDSLYSSYIALMPKSALAYDGLSSNYGDNYLYCYGTDEEGVYVSEPTELYNYSSDTSGDTADYVVKSITLRGQGGVTLMRSELSQEIQNIVVKLPKRSASSGSSNNNDQNIKISGLMFEKSTIDAYNDDIEVKLTGKVDIPDNYDLYYLYIDLHDTNSKKSITIAAPEIEAKDDGTFEITKKLSAHTFTGTYKIAQLIAECRVTYGEDEYDYTSRAYYGDAYTNYPNTLTDEMKKLTLTIKEDAGKWEKDSKGWKFKANDGKYVTNTWKFIDGKWYVFNASGYLKTGWVQSASKWYYMTTSGAASDWMKIDGKWYFFSTNPQDPYMFVKCIFSDGDSIYCLKESGEMATNYWVKRSFADGTTGWAYFGSDGKMAISKWVEGIYYMDANGKMATNQWIAGKYYVGADGKWVKDKKQVATGWKKSGSGWWYQNADGSYPANCWKKIDGKWYHFNKSGYMQTGWLKDGGAWYYLKSDGSMATGWIKDGGKWYYLESSGAMATNKWVGNYYLDASGVWTKSK